MLQIEWKSSHYHSDGRPRSRPKASTVHGWLVKWRATFSGNERLRKEGIREMREAKAVREWKKQRKVGRVAKSRASKCFFHRWPISRDKKKKQAQAPKGLPRATARHSSSKRPSNGSTRHLTSSIRSPRPTPSNTRRSSHNHRGARDRIPHSSRKAARNSRKESVQAAGKK